MSLNRFGGFSACNPSRYDGPRRPRGGGGVYIIIITV